jgi:hypothetical protein
VSRPVGPCGATFCSAGCERRSQCGEFCDPATRARPAQPALPLARTLAVEVPACLAVHPDTGEQCGLPEQPGHGWHCRQGEGRIVVWRVADDGAVTTWRGGR